MYTINIFRAHSSPDLDLERSIADSRPVTERPLSFQGSPARPQSASGCPPVPFDTRRPPARRELPRYIPTHPPGRTQPRGLLVARQRVTTKHQAIRKPLAIRPSLPGGPGAAQDTATKTLLPVSYPILCFIVQFRAAVKASVCTQPFPPLHSTPTPPKYFTYLFSPHLTFVCAPSHSFFHIIYNTPPACLPSFVKSSLDSTSHKAHQSSTTHSPSHTPRQIRLTDLETHQPVQRLT